MQHSSRSKFIAEVQATLWLIAIALTVSKLAGLIDWSWWIITAPITIQIAISFVNGFMIGFVRERMRRRGKGGLIL